MDSAKELADKMGVDYFNRKLIDETQQFLDLLEKKKKNLTKGDLINLVKGIVRYPDLKGHNPASQNNKGLLELGCQAKESYMALTVQVLVEEGQKQKEKPTRFKPQGK